MENREKSQYFLWERNEFKRFQKNNERKKLSLKHGNYICDDK